MGKIGENLKMLRKDRGLSQRELAKAIGYDFTTISCWEKGKISPSSDAVIELAKYFGISADILLGIKEW